MLMTDKEENTEDLLVDLQTRLAFQDHAISELSDVIASQQRQIDVLERRLKALDDKLITLEESVDTHHDNEKPPHY